MIDWCNMRDNMLRALAMALGMFMLTACDTPPEPASQALQGVLGGDAAGFARAVSPREFRFPQDHGPHPDYRSEWWYFTGNLDAADGERVGFQVTFFRFGLRADAAPRESDWASNQIWMAHAAVSTPDGRHIAAERFARQAQGLAGADGDPLRVWLEDWVLETTDQDSWELRIATEAFALDLVLRPARPIVLQGEAGLSQKSAEPGNASYYYSIPRLDAQGVVSLGEQQLAVTGLAWLDREWSTSALAADQAGWDWFALQFNDGRDLMYYRLRHHDGSTDAMSRGSLLEASGIRHDLSPANVGLKPLRWWQSPAGPRYPVAWELTLPDRRRLHVDAVVDDQLMDLTVRYWEGMVDVRDADSGTPVGRGYIELAGY